MQINKISFSDIVNLLKADINQNIFEICFKLGCSGGLLYRRMIPEGYRGLIELKNAIREGEL
ncbi:MULTISPECIES: hypothetical protein [Methanobacterium]|uniref:Transcriptional regulator n=1 Tax=Methanobacterium bryantii TaxID=2161 RepID=A0A2A2H9D0_METBR|nr:MULTISPECIES: hypothetical protein [Methanobacterium]OEC85681.1 hypothetical protein A9507_13065 [Methanobacterium sp. A39]PAV05884.1 hypothetical protein ASJ80_13555 [Methanobacterium bryantii]